MLSERFSFYPVRMQHTRCNFDIERYEV